MAELEVGEEGQGMDSAYTSIYLEQEVGNGLSREDITNHELCYNIIPRLLICGCLDDFHGKSN